MESSFAQDMLFGLAVLAIGVCAIAVSYYIKGFIGALLEAEAK